MKKTLKLLLPVIGVCFAIYFGNDFFRLFESGKASQSIGTVKNGRLVNGKRLPTKGVNFITCSRLSTFLGRNSVHNLVRDAILDSYDAMNKMKPEITFVYGETSWPGGKKLWTHKTHENGLSVDFFVPVKNSQGEPVVFPTSIFNKFGYGVEFDSLGRSEDLVIDFEAMAAHLFNLDLAAKRHGLGIVVVIFDNQLQSLLFSTKYGQLIKKTIKFSTLKPWVRHDEHYHADFYLAENQ